MDATSQSTRPLLSDTRRLKELFFIDEGSFEDMEQAMSMRLTAEDHYGYHLNHGRLA